jgi:hypothetical protein
MVSAERQSKVRGSVALPCLGSGVIDFEHAECAADIWPTPRRRVKTGPEHHVLAVVTFKKALLWVP